jgi:hypothetical protein
MSHAKLVTLSARLSAAVFLCLFLLQPGHNPFETPRDRFSTPAYIERGNRVEKRYESYGKRLAGYYQSLASVCKDDAPELLAHLRPLEPTPHGYQILPRITSDTSPEKPMHASAVAYSWPWTDRLIDHELQDILRSEAELHRARAMNAVQRRAILEKLAANYRLQSRRHRNIDAHVQYNRLWQAAIAADRSGYDQETALHNEVLERQNLIDRLKYLHGTAETSPGFLNSRLEEMTSTLRSREALLTRRIDRAMGTVRSPAFVNMENSDGEWVFRLPLFTDIEDREYVMAVKEIIENMWHLDDRKNRYRVVLDVAHISADVLYGDRAKPNVGEPLDIRDHLKRFPRGGAILTTGALTTHVQDYAIILGPHPVAPRVLAHEFGHILGFRDLYVRGYKNLGENGFQVLEVVADPGDIMAATSQGLVLRNHFVRLINGRTKLNAPIEPARKLLNG